MTYVLREYYAGKVLWHVAKKDIVMRDAENCFAACLNDESAKSLFLDEVSLTVQESPTTNLSALLNDSGLREKFLKNLVCMKTKMAKKSM